MGLLPDVRYGVSWATNPSATPSYTDTSGYLRHVNIRRGRSRELDRFEAATFTALVDNVDRRFEPDFAAGAYFPNVVPMRRARIQAIWAGVTYDIVYGFTKGYPQEYPLGGYDAQVAVDHVDGFEVINLARINNPSYPQELSGARVGRVLDGVGWPAADRTISTGETTVQAYAPGGRINGLQHINDVATTEFGRFFIARDGKATFQDRYAGFTAALDTTNSVFGDGGAGEKPYKDLVLDNTDIWNEVPAQRTGGTEQVASDATSQGSFFTRTLTGRSSLLHTTDAEVLDYATTIVTAYKNPGKRVAQLVLDPSLDATNMWPQVLARDLGDKIRVLRRPNGGGAAITQDSFIEGIAHDITLNGDGVVGSWRTTWNLSPIDRFYDYWVLGDAVQSILGSTTRVSY